MVNRTGQIAARADAVPEALLSIQHAGIDYRLGTSRVPAVGDVSFDVRPGETVTLLGPSGCGKSTLLKAIAGFLALTRGTIGIGGRNSPAPGPDRALVFQDFEQLFPWRTVRDNIAYPQRVNGRSRSEADDRTTDLLALMGLTDAAARYPHQLSGGMKQRVAIARALALDPAVLLMDEPFGALDAQTRSRLQRELLDVVARTGVTVLFVTHSIGEAIYLGDRVVVLSTAPSTVLQVVDVSDLTEAQASQAARQLRSLLGDDPAEESGADAAGADAAGPGAQPAALEHADLEGAA